MFASRRFLLSPIPAIRRSFTTTTPRDIARVHIIGRLAADPETITAGSHELVRLVVGCSHKSNDGEYKTSWYRVASFTESSRSYLQSLKKGTLVSVEGDIRNRVYEEDGKSRSTLSITSRSVNVLQKPRDSMSESDENEREGNEREG